VVVPWRRAFETALVESDGDVMDEQDQHVKEEYVSEEEHVTVPTSRPLRMRVRLGPPADYGLIGMVRKEDGVQVMVRKSSLESLQGMARG